MVTLAQIESYLFCPLLYYWQNETEVLREQGATRTTRDLPKLALQQSLSLYNSNAEFQQYDWPTLVDLVWRTWLEQKQVGIDVYQMLRSYEAERARIMAPFLAGKITAASGKAYVEPRASRKYKNQVDQLGLEAIAASTDNAALTIMGVTLAEISEIDLGLYHLVDAYADSMLMAASFPLPAPGIIRGVDEIGVVRFSLTHLEVEVDLVTEVNGKLYAHVLDATPLFYPGSRSWIPRRPGVIAAASVEFDRPGLKGLPSGGVIYRHLMSKTETHYPAGNQERLEQVLDMAVRGIEGGVFPPRFLDGDLTTCKKCSARGICIEGRTDALEQFMLGSQHLESLLIGIDQIDLTERQSAAVIDLVKRGAIADDFIR
jgi:hypothetical protein